MALDTYAGLKTAMAGFADVNAGDFSLVVDDVISLAEARIWREARCKEMEQSISATISGSTVAIPTNYLDLKFAYYVDSSGTSFNLRRMDAQWMRFNFPEGLSSGPPDYIGTEGSVFIFKPTPDSGHVLHGIMWATPDPVSTSANMLFQRHPNLYLYASLVELERVLKRPDMLQIWEMEYQRVLRRANRENFAGEGFAIGHYL